MTARSAEVVAQAALILTESLVFLLIDRGMLSGHDIFEAVDEVRLAWQAVGDGTWADDGGMEPYQILSDLNQAIADVLVKRRSH